MRNEPAIYNGKIIDKKNFRVYIYSPDDTQKLVESWEEYERHMADGLWFATKEDALASKIVEEVKEEPIVPVKRTRKEKDNKRKERIDEAIGVLGEIDIPIEPVNEAVEEVQEAVNQDDFLPK